MEAAGSSKVTITVYQTTWHHIQQGSNLEIHHVK